MYCCPFTRMNFIRVFPLLFGLEKIIKHSTWHSNFQFSRFAHGERDDPPGSAFLRSVPGNGALTGATLNDVGWQ